jgi:hypothetical protein
LGLLNSLCDPVAPVAATLAFFVTAWLEEPQPLAASSSVNVTMNAAAEGPPGRPSLLLVSSTRIGE